MIKDAGVEPEIIEYLKTPPDKHTLKQLVDMLGIAPHDLIRTQEKIYKENYKGQDLSDDEWLEVIAENPKLMERPVVVEGNKAVLGRPPENVKELL